MKYLDSKDVNNIKRVINLYCDMSDNEVAKDKVQHSWTNIIEILNHAHNENAIMILRCIDTRLDRQKQ
tara:strand:- start:144 stop:347 length:204 start_codon:yes stop_codon:yes gene_type:complete